MKMTKDLNTEEEVEFCLDISFTSNTMDGVSESYYLNTNMNMCLRFLRIQILQWNTRILNANMNAHWKYPWMHPWILQVNKFSSTHHSEYWSMYLLCGWQRSENKYTTTYLFASSMVTSQLPVCTRHHVTWHLIFNHDVFLVMLSHNIMKYWYILAEGKLNECLFLMINLLLYIILFKEYEYFLQIFKYECHCISNNFDYEYDIQVMYSNAYEYKYRIQIVHPCIVLIL